GGDTSRRQPPEGPRPGCQRCPGRPASVPRRTGWRWRRPSTRRPGGNESRSPGARPLDGGPEEIVRVGLVDPDLDEFTGVEGPGRVGDDHAAIDLRSLSLGPSAQEKVALFV